MPKFLAVQPFQETLFQGYCAPACIKMILEYYNIAASEQELAELCNTDPLLGSSHEGIKETFAKYGFSCDIKDFGTYEEIGSHLRKDIPVIVDWFSRGRNDYDESMVADGHYSVVVGLDENNIYMQDPEIGHMRTIKKDDFMRVWFDYKTDIITTWEDMIIREYIAIYKA